jgi:catechol 2,3-dioxygenase-like lactoylglutathione lyase family enzyme
MSTRVTRLLRIGITVANLPASVRFYEGALGFTAGPRTSCDPKLADVLGVDSVQSVLLSRGGQQIELTECSPPGAPYPAGSRSNDLWFQHCALTVGDMKAAYARLSGFAFTPISSNGPQRLPASSGGVTAFKFRDPEGHPLELIHFPGRPSPGGAADGIDHSAIAVADAGRSVAFYRALGLTVGSEGVNTGPAQDALDGLSGVRVGVVALMPAIATPHVELLDYRAPLGQPAAIRRSADIASTRLVMAATGLDAHAGAVRLRDGSLAALVRDPDGHALLLLEAPERPDA